MRGHVYVVHGDITQCVADAIAFSTSTSARGDGQLYSSYARLEGFVDALGALASQPWKVGDTQWISPTETRPGIVVAFSVGVGTRRDDREADIRDIVQNALACAVSSLRARAPDKRLLVLLPAFLIGAGGAKRQRQEMARYQLRAAADALSEYANVDVAFVLYQPADHAVFRDARREVSPDALADVRVPEHLVRAVSDRECVVFVGSGMSIPAGLPRWDQLVARLGGTGANAHEYLAIAEAYRQRCVTQPELTPVREIVRELFGRAPGRTPTLAHYLLASLDASNVITTNYDHLIEDSFVAIRENPLVVIDTKHVPETGTRSRVNVIKFHGDATDGADVVLSQSDYDQFFAKRPAFALLLSGLLLNQTFLFVGYSLSDPNFQQIHRQIGDMLGASTRRPVVTALGASTTVPVENVDVVAFAGDAAVTQMWRWLDRLVDDAVRPSSVLLAESESLETSPVLASLRAKLLEVALEIEDASKGPITDQEARLMAQLILMLFEHGFRPRRDDLLARLAAHLANRDQRVALLRHAASHAGSRSAAAAIERILATL